MNSKTIKLLSLIVIPLQEVIDNLYKVLLHPQRSVVWNINHHNEQQLARQKREPDKRILRTDGVEINCPELVFSDHP